jgi:hypothetical protein
MNLRYLMAKLKLMEEDGQSLVEFALALIFVIIPLTLVIIESAVMLYSYVALTNAAREGVRAGSVYLFVGDPGGTTTAPDAGRSAAVALAVQDTIGPLVTAPADCNGTAGTTTCQIAYGPPITTLFTDSLRSTEGMTVTLNYVHPLLFGALGSTIDLQARSSMIIEPAAIISGTLP